MYAFGDVPLWDKNCERVIVYHLSVLVKTFITQSSELRNIVKMIFTVLFLTVLARGRCQDKLWQVRNVRDAAEYCTGPHRAALPLAAGLSARSEP